MRSNTDLKILLLCGWYYPDSVGGTEAYVHLLGKDLQSLGCNVAIAAPSSNEKQQSYIDDGLSVYRYPVRLRPTRQEMKSNSHPGCFDAFKKWVGASAPDIVHMHSFTRGCGLSHAQYISKLGVPLIFTVHTSELICARGTMMRWGRIQCDGEIKERRCAACYLQKKGLLRPIAWLLSGMPYLLTGPFKHMENRLGTTLRIRRLSAGRGRYVNRLLDSSDHIVAVSRWLYDVLRLNGISASKLSLCRHGFLQQPKKREEPFARGPSATLRVGYLGRLNPVKGVHILIEAVKRLPKGLSIELRIYGRANDEKDRIYLAKLKKAAAGNRRILFYGELKESSRKEFFSSLDILAVPSLWLETGPLVVLEAKSFGLPVIGSNSGGIAELVNDGKDGILVETGNVSLWAQALKKLCQDTGSVKAMAKNISAIRTSKEVAQEMIAIYNNLLDSKERPG